VIDPRSLRRVLLVLFTVSGFSGLIYESIWSHYLKLMLGHAAYAQTLVLAIFMGGMAAGAWLASRRSERWKNPLAAYAVIEAVVGLLALAFHGMFTGALEALHTSLLPAVESAAAAGLTKWTLASLLILPQSILLGMTFPLVSAAIIRVCPQEPGSTLALLYFTNSFGACAGVLASGFVLIPWSGLPGTIRIAGILNVALAITVWTLARAVPSREPTGPATEPGRAGPLLLGLLGAALLTGAASFFYEIGWIRMLSLVLGTTTQAFELMLSAFILGLALGGLWIRRRIDRLASPLRFAGHVQLLMGAFALLTVPLWGATFDVMALMVERLSKTEEGYALFQLGSHVIALGVMLPATLMAGMTLPLFTFALLQRGCGERSIGRVYAANTIGAILGVLAAVHLVMPAVGTKGLIVAGALVDIVLGAALLFAARARLRRGELIAATAAAAVVLAVVTVGVRPDPRKTASGVYRYGLGRLPQGSEVIYHRDGKTATIDLIRDRDGTLKIVTNGKPDARIAVAGDVAAADEVTMMMLAAVPLSLHPDAGTVANIGMGSGMTTHTLLGADTLDRVDTIEIEAVVLEAARRFGPFVERAYSDPRSRLHVEDAKAFFSNRKERYDVIISEPSNPWVSGVASLFSEEFYRHIERHLEPGGLLVQWLHLYEADVELLASIFKALSVSFADYTVFNTDNSNVIVVATNSGNLDRLDPWILRQPQLRRDLARVGLTRLQDFEIRRIGSKHLLQPVFETLAAPPNSDFFPFLSLRAPRTRFLGADAADLTRLHVAPIPLTEMLDPSVRRSMLTHTDSPDFTPTRARGAAGKLVAALTSSDLTATRDETLLPLIQRLQIGCEEPAREQALLDAMTWLAAATNPYLRGPQLDRMWDKVAETVCEQQLSPRAADWLSLHRAVARREASAMATLATRLIDTAIPGQDRREIEYLACAGLTGLLASGDHEAARELAARVAVDHLRDDVTPFYMRLLFAQALKRGG
jgi:predicted membrane-bound spermidine synthase